MYEIVNKSKVFNGKLFLYIIITTLLVLRVLFFVLVEIVFESCSVQMHNIGSSFLSCVVGHI